MLNLLIRLLYTRHAYRTIIIYLSIFINFGFFSNPSVPYEKKWMEYQCYTTPFIPKCRLFYFYPKSNFSIFDHVIYIKMRYH